MKPLGVHNYYVYIITNKMRTVLYTGVTNNLQRRLWEHAHPKADSNSFTKSYKCHFIIFYERFQFIDRAIAREKEIKGWRRSKKEQLIARFNPEWKFLNDEIFGE